jgi:hypothetical protein
VARIVGWVRAVGKKDDKPAVEKWDTHRAGDVAHLTWPCSLEPKATAVATRAARDCGESRGKRGEVGDEMSDELAKTPWVRLIRTNIWFVTQKVKTNDSPETGTRLSDSLASRLLPTPDRERPRQRGTSDVEVKGASG